MLHVVIKAESIRKLRNFNFQWTKTLHQNNFNYLASFFTLFEGYIVIGNNSKEKGLMGTGKKTTSKASNSTKQNFTYDDFTCVFSIAVNFFSSGTLRSFPLELFQITYEIYSL